jgi:hypothetical protein
MYNIPLYVFKDGVSCAVSATRIIGPMLVLGTINLERYTGQIIVYLFIIQVMRGSTVIHQKFQWLGRLSSCSLRPAHLSNLMPDVCGGV